METRAVLMDATLESFSLSSVALDLAAENKVCRGTYWVKPFLYYAQKV